MTFNTGEDQAGVREEPASQSIPVDSFALRLKAVRLHAGDITIEQAAAQAGLLNQSWSNWEHGKTPRDKADIVHAISEAFGVDRQWLMWGGPLAPDRPLGRGRRHRAGGGSNVHYVPGVRKVRIDRPPSYPDGFRRPARITQPLAG